MIVKNQPIILLGLVLVFFVTLIHYPWDSFSGRGLSIPYNILILFVWVPVVSVLALIVITKRKIKFDDFFLLSLFFFVFMLIPLIWTKDIVAGGLKVGFVGLGVLSYFCFLNWSGVKKSYIVSAIATLTLVELLFGIIQKWEIFNWLLVDGVDYSRPLGIFGQTNVFSSFIVIGLVCSYLCIRNKGWIGRVILIVPLLVPYCLSMTLSRVGILSLAVVSILLVGVWHYEGRREIHKTWWKCFIFGCLLASFNVFVVRDYDFNLNDRIAFNNNSSAVRVETWVNSARMILERPLTGYGYGSFVPQYSQWWSQRTLANEAVGLYGLSMEHPHNEVVLFLFEGGLFLGKVFFSWLFL
ncbi:MAG: O-antigen ligase family protein [Thiomicrorhabdus sp.]|nr:O-antigen ligase family protein [Thiomicrorhabdus sp.]